MGWDTGTLNAWSLTVTPAQETLATEEPVNLLLVTFQTASLSEEATVPGPSSEGACCREETAPLTQGNSTAPIAPIERAAARHGPPFAWRGRMRTFTQGEIAHGRTASHPVPPAESTLALSFLREDIQDVATTCVRPTSASTPCAPN